MKAKLQGLVSDDRRFLTRLLPSAVVAFAVSFTFAVFGMVDIFIVNWREVPFPLLDVLGTVLLFGAAVFLTLALGLAVLRGRLFDAALSLVFGLLVAGYVQGNFLNLPLGQLTGDAIAWEKYTGHAIKNTLIWGALLAAPFVMHYFSKRVWRRAVLFGSALLIGMQGAALGGALLTSGALGAQPSAAYLSMAGAYEVGQKENVLVFIIDRLDNDYVQAVLGDQPDFFNGLDGFTYYRNNTSVYSRTFPSVAHMLTGQPFQFETTADEYLTRAWQEGAFVPALRTNGYGVKIYSHERYAYWNAGDLIGMADNVRQTAEHIAVKQRPTLIRLGLLSAYRYAPHALKPSFWRAETQFNRLMATPQEADAYDPSNADFAAGLAQHPLQKTGAEKNFAYYHLEGCHEPYTIDQTGQPNVSGASVTRLQNTKGCFEMVYAYLRQLKALGLYDNATIVITGDHGESSDHFNLRKPRLTALFFKPGGSASTPLAISDAPVSHAYFQASVLRAAGLDSTAFGTAYQDITEATPTVRTFYYRVEAHEGREYLEEFHIEGDAADFGNWHKIREIDILNPHG